MLALVEVWPLKCAILIVFSLSLATISPGDAVGSYWLCSRLNVFLPFLIQAKFSLGIGMFYEAVGEALRIIEFCSGSQKYIVW